MGLFNRKSNENVKVVEVERKVYKDEHGRWFVEGRSRGYPTERQATIVRDSMGGSDV